VADHAGVTAAARQIDRLQGFGQGADLIHLDQDRIRCAGIDALLKALAVGHEQVITHELHTAAPTGLTLQQ